MGACESPLVTCTVHDGLPTEPQWLSFADAHSCEALGIYTLCLCVQDMQDRLALDMEAEARAIPSKVHVFLIHGSEDATIPEQAAYEYAKVIKTNHLHIVQGGDHCFRGPDHRKELIEKVTDFMSR